MNIQPNTLGRPDTLERLSKLWGLTPKNEALARNYLAGEATDDDLLKEAESAGRSGRISARC